MRFAFILMGAFDAERDRAAIGGGAAEIAGVSNLEEAGASSCAARSGRRVRVRSSRRRGIESRSAT